MRGLKFTMLAGAAIGGAIAAPAQAAAYMPVGVQTNVATSTVTGGGWTECYSSTYGASGTSISSVLAGCSGTNLMMAARVTGSSTLLLLAQAATSDVTFNTGFSNVTHNANGVEWYFSNDWSWGFAPGGSTVSRNSCDTTSTSSSDRLCWHTGGGTMQGGWRAGSAVGLNSSTSYEKVLFTLSSVAAVPEPSTWALMIAGLGIMGFGLRRSRRSEQTVSVRYA